MPVSLGQTIGLQSFNAQNGSVGVSASFGTAPTPGSTVVVPLLVFEGTAQFGFTCSDNQGNTYAIDVQTAAFNADYMVFLFRAKNVASSGTFTVTITTPASGQAGDSYGRWGAAEIKSADTTAPFDKSANNTAASSPVSTGSTGTLSSSDEMAITVFGDSTASTSITTPTNFTSIWNDLSDANAFTMGFAYEIVSATTALNPSWSDSGNGACGAVIGTYKGAAAAGVPQGWQAEYPATAREKTIPVPYF